MNLSHNVYLLIHLNLISYFYNPFFIAFMINDAVLIWLAFYLCLLYNKNMNCSYVWVALYLALAVVDMHRLPLGIKDSNWRLSWESSKP